jgi:serine protease
MPVFDQFFGTARQFFHGECLSLGNPMGRFCLYGFRSNTRLRMKHTLFTLLLSLCGLATLSAQARADLAPTRKPGQVLLQVSDGFDIQAVVRHLRAQFDVSADIQIEKNLSKPWGIYALTFAEAEFFSAENLLATVRRAPGVRAAQWNHRAEERYTEPNDLEWWRQEDMTLINAPEAWDSSTGGVTPAGDTIVVAVLEKGILFTHPDLVPNRWWNWQEIPENGLDDDGNGYVDDFGGWNPRTLSDGMGNNNSHGTSVTGIIGAKGNNAQGVSGVNWNVKLMGIANVEYEDEIIAGYEYAAQMRRLYNQTNGAKGAFVVTTNASFGINMGKPEDYPLWCAVYDSLGALGVLNVGATANINIDVDVDGDMPSACPSEFLITVNNINKQGSKMPNTGYGDVSIDLGSPGHDTYTTTNAGGDTPGYGALGGTSAATPHVTGAVALLYSLGCEALTSDALSNPVACARRVRDVILNHTEPNLTLSGLTTTGGHLDLGNAVEAVRDLCDGVVGPLDVLEVQTSPNGGELTVFYQTPNFQAYTFRVFNALGQLMHEEKLQPDPFGENYVRFDSSTLPRGVYFLMVGRGTAVASRKFAKI